MTSFQTILTENDAEVLRELKGDFRKFLFVVWKHLGLPDPTPVQYDIAQYLQHGPRRKMVMAFRGVGKSWIYSAYICWRGLNNPQVNILVVSASKALADSLSIFVKRLLSEMEMLQHLCPREGQRDSQIMFDFGPAGAAKDPSVKSVGITGQITGSRADEILADDVESLNNSATDEGRAKLSEQLKEFDAVVKPGGKISFLGTPQSFMSVYSTLPEKGYQVRVWPAQVPSDPAAYGGRLAPFVHRLIEQGVEAGIPVDPLRFDARDLMERRASYGAAGYALQFMLDTSASDKLRFPLRLEDLIVMDLDRKRAPAWVSWGREDVVEDVPNPGFPGDRYYKPIGRSEDLDDYTGAVLSIDPAGRGKDETAYAVVKTLHSQLFVTAAGGLQGGYDDGTLKRLATIAKEHEVNKVIVEANFGDGMFTELFKPWLHKVDYKCAIEEVKHSVQKEARIIDTLEPVMMQHRLILDRKVIENDWRTINTATGEPNVVYSLFFQLTRITRDRGSLRHDDRLDALAIAVAYWSETLSRDVARAAQRTRDKEHDEQLKDFIRAVKGKPKRKPRPPRLPGKASRSGRAKSWL